MKLKNSIEHSNLIELLLSARKFVWQGGEDGGYNILNSRDEFVMRVWSEGQAVAMISFGEIIRCASDSKKTTAETLMLVQAFLR